MKKSMNFIKKLSTVVVTCLTLVLTINANTASCFILNEPEEPKNIEKFKMFK
ncbi:cyclic lactone autoinducer peptide [uncultured Eubacterium sp.]|uniref:cyclic lactone autoinducer peptide n=1 Tax=uncultured Eubacterium sp. TaxID=165185 RepID=UPI00258B1EE8|nr:cyclic lactone autoinducer peptide [uncultured Eubacterium sp.]